MTELTHMYLQVVHFQPQTKFINRAGFSICMRQCDTQMKEWLHPADSPKHFGWQSGKAELLKVCVISSPISKNAYIF